ncbi:hypothetical protein LDENG_00229680 [Lucifuga dentata]|nr:hypothetical protein LDENG_00229680 [Lucifuga dentata]
MYNSSHNATLRPRPGSVEGAGLGSGLAAAAAAERFRNPLHIRCGLLVQSSWGYLRAEDSWCGAGFGDLVTLLILFASYLGCLEFCKMVQ